MLARPIPENQAPLPEDGTHLADKKRLQELIQASKLALLGQLAAGIAHELRNPLAVLRIESDEIALLARALPSNAGEAALRHCETLNRNIAKMVSIIDRIQSMSSNAAAGFKKLDIRKVLDEVEHWSRRLIEPMGIALSIDEGAADPHFFGNEAQIEEVFFNLIRNASDAIRSSGRGSQVRIGTRSDGNHLVIQVANDGPAIPQSDLPHLFDPFFTTKPEGEGMGLGLSIVAEMVKGHGGTVDVESSAESGTTFRIRIPHDRRLAAREPRR